MFKGKTAFITGAGGYIGGGVSAQMAKKGAKIAVCDINQEAIDKTIARIADIGGTAKGYLIDVTESKSVNEVMNRAAKDLGGIDICIHIAGGSARIAGKEAKYTYLMNQEDYVIDKVLKVNLYGAMYVSRAAANFMAKQGRGGRIINFSSVVGTNGLKTCVEYAAAKGGVIAMTKALAKELGEYGITVNSVAPGVVMRPEEQDMDRAYNTNFLKRMCTADDIAGLVEYLASDEAGFITGQTYIIDGGRSLAMKGSD